MDNYTDHHFRQLLLVLGCRKLVVNLDVFLRCSQVLNGKELLRLLDCYLRSSELPITPQRLMSKLMERAESKQKPN